jgi:hypothetical protein
MPQLPPVLDEFIIKTKERLNQSNLKTYCRCCIDALGEQEGKKICFPNKTDRILQHLKKCTYFCEAAIPKMQIEIFSLSKNNEKQMDNQRSCKLLLLFQYEI